MKNILRAIVLLVFSSALVAAETEPISEPDAVVMGQGEDAMDDGNRGVEQVPLTETTLEEIVAETPKEVEEETAAENAKEIIVDEAIHESEIVQGEEEALHVQLKAGKEKEAAEPSEEDATRRLEEEQTAKDSAEKLEVEDDAEARRHEEETESIRVEEVDAETKRLEEKAESIRLEEEEGMAEDIRLAEEARLVDDQRRAQVVEEELRVEEIAESIRLEEEGGMAEDVRLAEEARMHVQEVEAQARRFDEDDARAAKVAGSSQTGDANCAADGDRTGPRSSPVIGGPLRVTLLLSAESYPAGLISLAGELRNRSHQVAFLGDARIWSRVQDLAPRGATFTAIETQSPPMDLLDSLTDLASMLPAALAPIVAQIQWIQQAYGSQVGALGLAKLRPDVVVLPSTGTGLYDAAEAEAPGARIVVLQTLSPELVVVGVPTFSTDPRHRIVNAFWSGVNPLLHAAPTIFANYHRQARGLSLLVDHHDYWMRHVNILPIPSSPATAPNLIAVGPMVASPVDVSESSSKYPALGAEAAALKFVAARAFEGVPVVYVTFGDEALDSVFVETVMWGMQDSRWATLWSMPAAVRSRTDETSWPRDRRGTRFHVSDFSAHGHVLAHPNVKAMVTGGSLATITEAVLVGKPCVMVPGPGPASTLARRLQKEGAGLVVSPRHGLMSAQISDAVLAAYATYATAASAMGVNWSAYNGAALAADTIEKVANGDLDSTISPELTLPYYQRHNLDVGTVFLVLFFVAWKAARLFVELLSFCCCGLCHRSRRSARTSSRSATPVSADKKDQ